MVKDRKARLFILYSSLIVVGLYFLFKIVVAARPFLVPLTIAILLAMLMAPIAKRLERWGMGKGLSAFLSDLVLIAFTVGLFAVMGVQVHRIKQDWPKLKKELMKKAEELDQRIQQYPWLSDQVPSMSKNFQQFISTSEKAARGNEGQDKKTGAEKASGGESKSDKNSPTGSQTASSPSNSPFSGNVLSQSWKIISSFFAFLGTMLLVFVYVFFFITYRDKFKKSILRFVPREKNGETEDMIEGASRVAQHYLLGRLVLIILLIVFYSIGLMLSGVKYAILISVLAAILSLVPYVGNLVAVVFAMTMATLSSEGSIIGVLITFGATQFVDTYFLEPFFLGHKVSLNPVVTIVAVIFGEFIWGIPGMVVAIPVLGIIKVVTDHVQVLNPIGYALGEDGIDNEGSFFKKAESWINRRFKK